MFHSVSKESAIFFLNLILFSVEQRTSLMFSVWLGCCLRILLHYGTFSLICLPYPSSCCYLRSNDLLVTYEAMKSVFILWLNYTRWSTKGTSVSFYYNFLIIVKEKTCEWIQMNAALWDFFNDRKACFCFLISKIYAMLHSFVVFFWGILVVSFVKREPSDASTLVYKNVFNR